MGDEVTLTVNGGVLSGWKDVRISLRCEGLPNDFELGLSSFDPLSGFQTLAQAGDRVELRVGDDLLITGYVDDDGVDLSPESDNFTLTGRGRTQDLIDCSAQWPGGLITASTMQQLCAKLGEPYGIKAVVADGTALPSGTIPVLALNYGENCAEIIGRVARNQRVLYYERPDGNLLLSQVGRVRAASGLVYGQNAQRWAVRNSMAERYSKVLCAQFSTNPVYDQGDGGFNLFGELDDPNVSRPRTLIINTEGLSKEVADAKAQWEVARRAGRGTILRASLDSWRDEAGVIWTPNTILPCAGPGLRRPNGASPTGAIDLCLSEVTFRYGEDGGTIADMVLMPPEAFSPEPIQLQPPEPDVAPIGGQSAPPQY